MQPLSSATRPRPRKRVLHLAYRYNRRVKFPTLTVAALAVCLTLLGGCKKDIQNQDAIRKGVMNYLSKRSDLLAMDVSVASVEFRQDEATATVHFQAKGNSSPGAGMNWQYILEREGSEWVVKGKVGENAAHGANGTPPPAAGSPAAPGSMSG